MKHIQFPALLALLISAFASSVNGQSVDLLAGDTLGPNVVIPDGTTVNVLGGDIGLGVDLSNGTLNVSSGNVAVGSSGIATGFTNTNNTVNVTGGNVGGFFQLIGSTEFNLSGGTIESFGLFDNDTVANITGGTVTRFPDILSGTANISGGDLFSVRVFNGAEVNFFGSEFSLNGSPLALTPGQEFVIDTRDETLTGTLADGSALEFTLSSSVGAFGGPEPDTAQTGARVTVTLVPSIPEPMSLPLFCWVGGLALFRRVRKNN